MPSRRYRAADSCLWPQETGLTAHRPAQSSTPCLPLRPYAPFRNAAPLPTSRSPLGIKEPVKLDIFGHEPGPAGLVAGAKPCAIVTVEVFVKEYVIAPVGVALELLCSAVDGSPALIVAGENPGEPVGDFLAHFEEVHHLAGPRGAFDLEVVAVVEVEVRSARMMSAFTGIQIGPRQLELPPNMPVLDSAGR